MGLKLCIHHTRLSFWLRFLWLSVLLAYSYSPSWRSQFLNINCTPYNISWILSYTLNNGLQLVIFMKRRVEKWIWSPNTTQLTVCVWEEGGYMNDILIEQMWSCSTYLFIAPFYSAAYLHSILLIKIKWAVFIALCSYNSLIASIKMIYK